MASNDDRSDSYSGHIDYRDEAELLEEADVLSPDPYKRDYTVLTEADIRQRQEDDITNVSTFLSVSRDSAIILLRRHNWNLSKVYDVWVDDNEAQESLEKPSQAGGNPNAGELTCGICFESCPCDCFYSASCGHLYCSGCWAGYIGTSINNGPGCFSLRCPYQGCRTAVTHRMVDQLAPDDDAKEKYARFFLRSYIEGSRKIKWCPAPDCKYAIEFTDGTGSGASYDVSCLCSYSFCWNCTEEAHRPVDCEIVSKWIMKNGSESENTNWILANTKPCPKCNRNIEKDRGCMHMRCGDPCRFDFCWLCLGPWPHKTQCNSYKKANEALSKREMAKKSLQRYTHYYERWAANHSSRQKALDALHEVKTVHLQKLGDLQAVPQTHLKFVVEAWEQIIECRRVLKWTYAYGYYLPEEETGKKVFFDYLQGQSEACLERLHGCAEKELNQFLKKDGASASSCSFTEFHTKLAGLTLVTKNYFENLVKALENGLPDVDSGMSSGAAVTQGPIDRGEAGTSRKRTKRNI